MYASLSVVLLQEVMAYIRAHPDLVMQATQEVYGAPQTLRPAPAPAKKPAPLQAQQPPHRNMTQGAVAVTACRRCAPSGNGHHVLLVSRVGRLSLASVSAGAAPFGVSSGCRHDVRSL